MSTMIVFDMDGVLVDVSDSYRETICQTAQHFSGRPVTRELVQEYKNRGGFNNDWVLSQAIARDLGADVPLETVAGYFNSIFYGGLMQRERWIPRDGLVRSLAEDYRLAIFTGRPREEALITLRRFATEDTFQPLIAAEDVVRGKPDPEGLRQIQASHPETALIYVGDTVDDARSAAGAGVPFIGIAHRDAYHAGRLIELFREHRAAAVIDDVNLLPEVLSRL
jgi:HAD superfamily phosphatase